LRSIKLSLAWTVRHRRDTPQAGSVRYIALIVSLITS